MPDHKIHFTIPSKQLLNKDAVFEIMSDGKRLGRLLVSQGSLDWVPRGEHRTPPM